MLRVAAVVALAVVSADLALVPLGLAESEAVQEAVQELWPVAAAVLLVVVVVVAAAALAAEPAVQAFAAARELVAVVISLFSFQC